MLPQDISLVARDGLASNARSIASMSPASMSFFKDTSPTYRNPMFRRAFSTSPSDDSKERERRIESETILALSNQKTLLLRFKDRRIPTSNITGSRVLYRRLETKRRRIVGPHERNIGIRFDLRCHPHAPQRGIHDHASDAFAENVFRCPLRRTERPTLFAPLESIGVRFRQILLKIPFYDFYGFFKSNIHDSRQRLILIGCKISPYFIIGNRRGQKSA